MKNYRECVEWLCEKMIHSHFNGDMWVRPSPATEGIAFAFNKKYDLVSEDVKKEFDRQLKLIHEGKRKI